MVLTDDDFATIVAAVRDGRRAPDNLRKFVLYIFAHAMPEVVPFALFALSAGRVPLSADGTANPCHRPGNRNVARAGSGPGARRARCDDPTTSTRHERLISARLLTRAWLLMGSISAVLALGVFFAVLLHGGWHAGDPVGRHSPLGHVYLQATTTTFATIVACQLGTAFAARTERSALRDVGVFTNPLLLVGIAAEIALPVR